MHQAATFLTDTATLCVFDLAALRHRLNDVPDWWCDKEAELAEVNAGNVVFVDLGSDGAYEILVSEEKAGRIGAYQNLGCPSGRVFIGAGEEVTSDGLEPECVRGGLILQIMPGSYRVNISRDGQQIYIAFIRGSASATNAFTTKLALT